MSLKFEWDSDKAELNKEKHKVSFEDALTVFSDTLSKTIPDPLHSLGEERFLTVGQSKNNKIVVVAHTDKGDKIRIISARLATKREKTTYEET